MNDKQQLYCRLHSAWIGNQLNDKQYNKMVELYNSMTLEEKLGVGNHLAQEK